MESSNDRTGQSRQGEGNNLSTGETGTQFGGYTQGSDLINAPSPSRDRSRPDPPSGAESFHYYYQPEPSFSAPPIPFPSPRLPDGSLPSLPGSQHTFFPNFARYGADGSPLVNVSALNNTFGIFSNSVHQRPTPNEAGTGVNGTQQHAATVTSGSPLATVCGSLPRSGEHPMVPFE